MKWSDSGGDFEQPPVGTHVARCIKLIDIGTQKNEYQGKVSFRRQVIVGWELPTEFMEDGRPFVVSRFYTASLGEKANLRKDLANWRGRDFTKDELAGFEGRQILGKTCMLSLTMNDAGKVRVTGVMAAPKGVAVPAQVNPSVYFSMDEQPFDRTTFEALSDGYKKFIVVSPEYAEATGRSAGDDPNRLAAADDGDVPF